MRSHSLYRIFLPALLFVALAACGRPREEAVPLLLEDPNANSLNREVEDAIRDLETGRNALAEEPAEARPALDSALRRLNLVASYYLPLMQARERAFNSFHLHSHHKTEETLRELDLIEGLLLGFAKDHGERLAGEMETPLAVVEEARLAVSRQRQEEASAALVTLTQKLNALIVKGRLVTE